MPATQAKQLDDHKPKAGKGKKLREYKSVSIEGVRIELLAEKFGLIPRFAMVYEGLPKIRSLLKFDIFVRKEGVDILMHDHICFGRLFELRNFLESVQNDESRSSNTLKSEDLLLEATFRQVAVGQAVANCCMPTAEFQELMSRSGTLPIRVECKMEFELSTDEITRIVDQIDELDDAIGPTAG